MTRNEAFKIVVDICTNCDNIKPAFELARLFNITLTDIWEDEEIIGIAIDDEVIYY